MITEILLLLAFGLLAHLIDYRVLKNYHLRRQKWDLNVSCGSTDGGGLNADIVPRKVPNFVLLRDVYKLPFKDKSFKNVVSSHTIEHVEDPERFFKELNRISENVVLLVPPVWDLAAIGFFTQHKWQFLTLKTRHTNSLPKRIKLPYW